VRDAKAVLTREQALATIVSIRKEFESKTAHLHELNEAATRLLVIDRILEAIGWDKEQFNPEEYSGSAGYTDYLLKVDDEPRLIVEAKKSGQTFFSNKRLAKTEYHLGYVRTAFGQPVADVLAQAERYARQHQVAFAVITNGGEWLVVQLIPSAGQSIDDLRCFYFGNLLSEQSNFDLFWGLVSRVAVADGVLAEQFSQLNVQESEFGASPRAELSPFTWKRACSPDMQVERFYGLFFDEIIDPARELMLQHCFVSTSKLDQYEGSLRRVLRDTAPKYVDVTSDLTPGEHDSLLQNNMGDRAGRVVLIAGSVGCGKSTFVTKVLLEARRQKVKNTRAVLVDLIDEHEPPDPTALLWRRVHEQWKRREGESLRYEELTKIFRQQLRQLKRGPQARLFESDQQAYVRAEAGLLDELARDPEQFLQACWRYYATEKATGIVVFLDNVDRASESFQRNVYNFAHRIAHQTGATVLVTMREATYFRGKKHDFLDVRTNDVVFHLQSPDPVQIIARRIRYVEELTAADTRFEHLKQDIDVFRRHAEVVKLRLLDPASDRTLLQLLSSLAWHDVRSLLASLRQIHVALGADVDWSVGNVLAALMTMRDGDGSPTIPNLYRPPYPAYPSLFVRARILATLLYMPGPEILRTGVSLATLLRSLRVFGYHDPWIRRAIEEMVRERLLECLEAPAAAEYSKNYLVEPHHSYRPSPFALTLFESLQREPIYLALVGAEMTYHSRGAYDEYVKCMRELAAAVGGSELDATAAQLCAESDAPKIAGRYLAEAFRREQPLSDVTKYSADAFAIESRLKSILENLPGFLAAGKTKSKPPSKLLERPSEQLELTLPTGEQAVAKPSSSVGAADCPAGVREASLKSPTLAPAIFWALVVLMSRGRELATGSEITRVLNDCIFTDTEKKEPTNVSRALRHPMLRSQTWLVVAGEKGAWRYGLSQGWREQWQSVFEIPLPSTLALPPPVA
jgi:hypothetical protein